MNIIEWLFNPWVICIVVVSVVAGNIAALKYSAKMKFDYTDKTQRDLDKLNALDKHNHQGEQKSMAEKNQDS